MIILKNKERQELFSIPQSFDEIGFDYVSRCVEAVNVREHYALVALLTTAPLIDFTNTDRKGVGSTEFILVKATYPTGTTQEEIPINKFLYAAPSDIFSGISCNTSINELSVNKVRRFIESSKDLSLSITRGEVFRNVSMTGASNVISNISSVSSINSPKLILDSTVSKLVTCLDFKIIRITDIIGWNEKRSIKDTVDVNRYIVPATLVDIK